MNPRREEDWVDIHIGAEGKPLDAPRWVWTGMAPLIKVVYCGQAITFRDGKILLDGKEHK